MQLNYSEETTGLAMPVNPADPETMSVVQQFLEEQPSSWIGFWTLEELLQLIQNRYMFPVVIVEEGEPQGLLLYSIHKYSPFVTSAKLEFMTCKAVFKGSKWLPLLESFLKANDITMVEAVAHPTLAQFLNQRHGYAAPSVYVVKTLIEDNERN